MPYQRLTVFLVDQKAGLLTRTYRVVVGARTDSTDLTRTLSGAGCQQVVTLHEGMVMDDLRESTVPG